MARNRLLLKLGYRFKQKTNKQKKLTTFHLIALLCGGRVTHDGKLIVESFRLGLNLPSTSQRLTLTVALLKQLLEALKLKTSY